MYKYIEDKSEIFITPIPKKITRLGFRLILLITLLIIVMAANIKPVKQLTYPLTISMTEKYIEMNIADYGQIKKITKGTLRLPFSDTAMELFIDKKNTEVWHDKVHIPVLIDNNTLSGLRIKDKMKYVVEVNFSEQSLLQRVIQNLRIIDN